MDIDLRYKDEADRCYGAAGMAIGIVVMDGEDYIDHISIDAPASGMIEFTRDYYVTANPRLSVKSSWNQLLRSYNVSVISTIANVMCRSIVKDNMPVRYEVKQFLHDCVGEEGRDTCQLEDDEIDRVFEKNYSYLHRIFNHRGVQAVAHEFADEIRQRRLMTRYEIIEQLKALSMI